MFHASRAANQSKIEDFFAQFPYFDYNPTEPVNEEFRRLCRDPKLHKEMEQRGFIPLGTFFDAFEGDFNDIFRWKYICEVLGHKVSPSITESEAREMVS
jgi:hypothetical protein